MSNQQPKQPQPPKQPRRPARRGGRATAAFSGVLVLGVAAAAVASGPALDERGLPEIPQLETPTITLDPTEVALGCAAAPAATMGAAAVVDPSAPPEDTSSSTQRRVVSLPRPDTDPAPTTVDGTSLSVLGKLLSYEDAGAKAVVVSAPPFRGRTAAPAGATVSLARGGDLRGLVATPCALPQEVTWLVGGGSEVGESVQLTLSNVGGRPASVDVTAYGSLGELAAPALTQISLAPGKSTSILVEGALAPDPTLALRVESSGGQVAAWGQWLTLDGLVPGGISALVGAASPTTEQIIPVAAGTEQDPATVRLVNPGSHPASVTIEDVTAEGARSSVGTITVNPTAVVDVALPGHVASALAIRSDEPVAAAALLRRTGQPSLLDPETPPADTAWSPAVSPRTAWAWALPERGDGATTARLTVVGARNAQTDVTVTVYGADGGAPQEQVLTIPAGGLTTLDVPAQAAALVLGSAEPIAAGMLLTASAPDGELIDVLPGTPDPHADQELRVSVR